MHQSSFLYGGIYIFQVTSNTCSYFTVEQLWEQNSKAKYLQSSYTSIPPTTSKAVLKILLVASRKWRGFSSTHVTLQLSSHNALLSGHRKPAESWSQLYTPGGDHIRRLKSKTENLLRNGVCCLNCCLKMDYSFNIFTSIRILCCSFRHMEWISHPMRTVSLRS